MEDNEFSAEAEPVHDDDDEIAHFLIAHAFGALGRVCRFVVAPWYGPQRVELRRDDLRWPIPVPAAYDGRVLYAQKEIKVTLGGCGG